MKRILLCIFTLLIFIASNCYPQVISSGVYSSHAVCSDGSVRGWGDNQIAEIGNDVDTGQYCVPDSARISGVRAISAGDYRTFALKNDSTVWAWGSNSYGRLGIGDSINYTIRH